VGRGSPLYLGLKVWWEFVMEQYVGKKLPFPRVIKYEICCVTLLTENTLTTKDNSTKKIQNLSPRHLRTQSPLNISVYSLCLEKASQ